MGPPHAISTQPLSRKSRKTRAFRRNKVQPLARFVPNRSKAYVYRCGCGRGAPRRISSTTMETQMTNKTSVKTSVVMALGALGVVAATSSHAADLVIATVNNGHMIEMQKHTKDFEKANPGITLKWVTLEEGVLRQRVTTDIATK